MSDLDLTPISDFVNIVQLLDSSVDRPNPYNAMRQTLVLTMDRWDELEEIITQRMGNN